jgi:light-regulated signal transduction histidine kinase (bacteriophytochrome)
MLEIENQYKQIVEQKAKLELMGQQLKMTNAHLEEKVIDRTRELEEKNTHLAEYTFINVHLLRGPLCRIIGLTNLMSLEQHKEETIHLLNLLKESNTELEQLIKKITIVLEAGEALNRNTLQ